MQYRGVIEPVAAVVRDEYSGPCDENSLFTVVIPWAVWFVPRYPDVLTAWVDLIDDSRLITKPRQREGFCTLGRNYQAESGLGSLARISFLTNFPRL